MSKRYGPYIVRGPHVSTDAIVEAGQTVSINAYGTIDFGGAVFGMGSPKLGPDGDDWDTPSDYPAPDLRKNSLICAIGGQWYQGGSAAQFVSATNGRLFLAANDKDVQDNSRGWRVAVEIS